MKFLVVLVGFLGAHGHACTCSEETAFSKGFGAIINKGWAAEGQRENFELSVHGEHYVVMPKGLAENQRGGGHPEAAVHRESCEVTRVSLAR